MERRTYLRSLGATGAASLAGCLGRENGNTGSSQTVLDAPTGRRGDPSHPLHGEKFPSFSLPDPLTGKTVSLDDFVGERPFVITFFYTSCPDGACPSLLLRLRRIQADAAERGYTDDIGLLAVTFDPERDTPSVLKQYAKEQGVNLEAGNWHFLRPKSYKRAKQVVQEKIGMPFTKNNKGGSKKGEANQSTKSDTHNETTQHNESAQNQGGHGHSGHDHGGYSFTHYNLIMLVNEQGIVERAYPRSISQFEIKTIVEDTRTVVQN